MSTEWIERSEIGVIEWRGRATGNAFRGGMDRALALLVAFRGSRLLVDARWLEAIDDADRQWLSERWRPRAEEVGLEYVAVVAPRGSVGRLSMDVAIERPEAEGGIERYVTDDVEDARNWLRSRPATLTDDADGRADGRSPSRGRTGSGDPDAGEPPSARSNPLGPIAGEQPGRAGTVDRSGTGTGPETDGGVVDREPEFVVEGSTDAVSPVSGPVTNLVFGGLAGFQVAVLALILATLTVGTPAATGNAAADAGLVLLAGTLAGAAVGRAFLARSDVA